MRITSSNRTRPAPRDLSLWFVLITLAVTTALHSLTDIHLIIPYHSIYRSLYYVPIAVAAVRYGRWGGILTALVASALYFPHVLLSYQMLPSDGFNDLLENVIYVFVGVLAGSLADAERKQRERVQATAGQLAAANTQLQIQAALAERMRASTSSILESIDSGVITLDTNGQITTTNRAAQALLNCSDDPGEPMPTVIRDYLAGGARGYQQVVVAGHRLGIHGSALTGAADEPLGTVLVLDDLTELRALEEQVQRAQRLAALGRLAGGLAHEIRNPLAITRAAAQILQREIGERQPLSEYTHVIQVEIDRVDRLVEQLLAYARPLSLQRGPVDVATVLDCTVALTRAYAVQHSVTLEIEAPEDLPMVEGDAELLHQALVNLLLNGINATSGGGMVRVRAHAVPPESRSPSLMTLTVSDTGHGIAPTDLPHIFDPFFTTRVDGTGLGLSIVQQIVEEHNGTVDVHSQPGRGTTVVLHLPTLRR